MLMTRIVIVFLNIRQVIKADNALRENKILSRIIPVPETISSECGMCIELDPVDELKIKSILDNQQLIYRLENI
jgi:hypothetical protein